MGIYHLCVDIGYGILTEIDGEKSYGRLTSARARAYRILKSGSTPQVDEDIIIVAYDGELPKVFKWREVSKIGAVIKFGFSRDVQYMSFERNKTYSLHSDGTIGKGEPNED